MAATDKHYRSQKALDVVFGVSCVLLLVTTFWMLYDDHVKPYKEVQRDFRDVEAALYQRVLLDKYPAEKMDDVTAARQAVADARKTLDEAKAKLSQPEAWFKQKGLEKARLEAEYQDKKANFDSFGSLLNIAIDDRDAAAPGPKKDSLAKEAEKRKTEIAALDVELQGLQKKIAENEYATASVLADQKKAEEDVGRAEDAFKKLTNEFDRAAKTAAQKRWKFGDWFRSLPIIDGFASAYRIQQVTLNDLTIDYGGFKDVPRYDRCTTCHLGIDRPSFDAASLAKLGDTPDEAKTKYKDAVAFLKDRAKNKEALGFDPDDLPGDLRGAKLSSSQVKEYCAHPRLDLFVDANSAHPVEKFGCTTCHAGQGSATEFVLATHTPNDAAQARTWTKEKGWRSLHDWEFPMLPNRFVESSCLKCHHQVTDLVRSGSKEEAPKLLKGYNLVRENGCFGCHEIAGTKGGRSIGPDMRLEPSPALEQLTPDERAKVLSDPTNPPGTLRKVGPSLRRLAEKTSEEWTRKWIESPRGFRPDTRMPHFYNLSTNSPDVLPEEQKNLPAAEMHAIAFYLFAESRDYLKGADKYRLANEARLKELEDKQKNNTTSEKERKELIEVQRRLELAVKPTPLSQRVVDGDGKPVTLPAAANDKAVLAGRRLFTEKGCLACHSHRATEKAGTDGDGKEIAAVVGEAHFGPNLSRIAAKIGGGNKDAGRRWLVQWILNPNVHFPRTRMPITHLTPEEAGLVADWLLSQDAKDWNPDDVPAPTVDTLKDLARVYLKKAPGVSPLEVDGVLEKGFADERTRAPLMAPDADEQALKGDLTPEKLKYYIGKKSISRLGCFGCHEIPGFEFAKPVGTPLNDWGKKDPARLAFEDAAAFVKDTYHVAELRDDPKDPTKPAKEWEAKEGKRPYEKFFADSLGHHQRDGFLHQKLMEPRSYDYHREVKWDDRLRMPQFRFVHAKARAGESEEDFKAREEKEEAEGREAVMTFVLGLVAEPVAAKYVNNPAPDRAAEIKGRQVLDKFNCAGCHQVRAGLYDVKLTADALEAIQKRSKKDPADFDILRAHNSWGATTTQTGEKATLHGFPTAKQAGEETYSLALTEALRVDRGDTQAEVRAGNIVTVPREAVENLDVTRPYGGTFAELLLPYLARKNATIYNLDALGESDQGRAAGPPPLVREGERVQPDWLFRFLKEPHKIRPLTVLRMPRFNLSDEDAQALVNYFAGADRSSNPGIGLTYPYLNVPQREEAYWRERTKQYVDRLGKDKVEARLKAMRPAWERTLKDQLAEAERQLESAKSRVASAKEDAVRQTAMTLEAETKKTVDALKARVDKGDYEAYRHSYLESEAYATDAFRLLTDASSQKCLKCHRVGNNIPDQEQGPPLESVFERRRPDWVQRWVALPQRLLTYRSVMPQNFSNDKTELQNLFEGDSFEQISALRDVLMNYPKVSELPGVRYGAAPAGGNK